MKATLLVLAIVFGAALPVEAASAQTNDKVLYDFKGSTDGGRPYAGVISANGTLYGTASYGGASGNGAVFSLNPATGAEATVYSFRGGNAADGSAPDDSLINLGGTLYGTTLGGGSANCMETCGTVFSVNIKTGAEKVLHAFRGGSDGAGPQANLINVGGVLYGTSDYGGGSANCTLGCGTVFSINPKTGAETVVYSFQGGPDGATPVAGLINVGGILYGTTLLGGNTAQCYGGCGTVFSVNPATGAERILHTFQGGSDGNSPEAGLINVGGKLYGTTQEGGTSSNCTAGCGTVFSFNPGTGVWKIVYSFKGPANDGGWPYSALININGTLYGTTYYGGALNRGTVYSLNPNTGSEAVLYSFQPGNVSGDGASPTAGLINLAGTLYGTTLNGGNAGCGRNNPGCGMVFSILP